MQESGFVAMCSNSCIPLEAVGVLTIIFKGYCS